MRKFFVIHLLMSFMIIFAATLVSAETKETSSAQKQKVSAKKKTLKIPKVADAALAGYTEESDIYIVRDTDEILIFSKVYVVEPDRESLLGPYGYFRVVSATTNVLLFAAKMWSPPNDNNSIEVVGDKKIVVLYQRKPLSNYSISVYAYYTGLITLELGTKEPIFRDLDGDGNFEIMAHNYFPTAIGGKIFEATATALSHEYIEGPILAIYRHEREECLCFKRVKGRSFEKYFMEHAKNLIEKKYPEWLGKAKANSFEIKTKRQLNWIIEGWLATVESTENSELIKEALQRLKTLPYPTEEEKQKLLEKLIQNGYPMLKTN